MTTQRVSTQSRLKSIRGSRPGKRASFTRWGASVVAFALGGCGFLGQTGESFADDAYAALDAGDLPGAASQFEALYAAHPTSMPVGIGHAYFQLIQGDIAGADQTLGGLEAGAIDEEKAKLRLRRAMVAIEGNRMGEDTFEAIRLHAHASGLKVAKLIEAEWMLVDWQREEAEALFRELSDEPGVVGETAETHLGWLALEDDIGEDVSNMHAQWALGDILPALDNARESLLTDEPLPFENTDEMLLVWAGRAASQRYDELAMGLLDQMDGPAGQPWRMHATKAIVDVTLGDIKAATEMLDLLDRMPDVPSDGVADARATACMLAPDKVVAKKLVEGLESAAAARCLMLAGAPQAAKQAAPQGILKSYLENR